MASAGSVFVDLLLRDAQYKQGWQRARVYTQSGSRQIQGDVGKLRQSFEGVLNPINNLGTAIRNLGVVVAASLSVEKLIKYSDTWKQLEGRLKVVQGDFENIGDTQQRLFEIAQRTRQPLENILGFYSRLKQFIPEAERAQYDLFNTTEGVATALALTGEISESATAAMIQLTQAIGTNFESAGQELRSLQEQAPRLTTAIQRAFGDGDQTLQQLVKTGVLTRETFLAIFQEGSAEFQKLRAELDKMPLTVSQAFQRLDNAMLKFIGQSKEAGNVTGALALGISKLAENLEAVAKLITGIVLVASIRLLVETGKEIKSRLLVNAALIAQTNAMKGLTTQTGLYIVAQKGANAALVGFNAGLSMTKFGTTFNAAANATKTVGLLTTVTSGFLTLGRGLITLLGGPWVAAFTLAAGAVYYLSVQQSSAEKIAEKYSETFSDLSFETIKLAEAQEGYNESLKLENLNKFREKLVELKEEIKDVSIELQKGKIEGLSFFAFGQKAADQIEFRKTLREIGEEFSKTNDIELYKKQLEDLISRFPQFSEAADSARDRVVALRTVLAEEQKILSEIGPNIKLAPVPGVKPTPPTRIVQPSSNTKTLSEQEKFLKSHRELLSGLDTETLRYIDTEKELNEAYKQGWIDLNQLHTALENLDKQYNKNAETVNAWGIDVAKFGERAAENLQDAFADFFFDPFEEGLDGMLLGFVNAIRRMAAEAAAANLGAILFGNKDSDGNTSSGGILSGIGDFFAGFFADGGVIPQGQWGIVGEEGPEMIYSGSSPQTIVPMRGAGGGDVINIDARGAGPGVGEEIRRVMNEVMALRKEVPGMAVSAVSNANKRNPRYLNG